MSSMIRSAFVTVAGAVKSLRPEASFARSPSLPAASSASSALCTNVPAKTLLACATPVALLSPTAPKLFWRAAPADCKVSERPLAIFTLASISAFRDVAVPDLALKSSAVLSHMCMAKTELLDLPPHMRVLSPSQTAEADIGGELHKQRIGSDGRVLGMYES